MKKILFLLIILIFALSWALEFNISVNYKLNVSVIASTKAYPLTVPLLVAKGYIDLQKRPLTNNYFPVLSSYLRPNFVNLTIPLKLKLFNIHTFLSKRFVSFSNFKILSGNLKKSLISLNIFSTPLLLKNIFPKSNFNKKVIVLDTRISLLNTILKFPKVINIISYKNYSSKTFISFKKFNYVKFKKPELRFSSLDVLNVKNLFPILQKKKFYSKNSTVAFTYGDGYDFSFSVPFPLKMDYNGISLKVLSEYGKLTMQSSKLYYSYSLLYDFNKDWSIKADVDLQSEVSDALISYDLNNWIFSLGMKYNFANSSLLPLGKILFDNSYLSFEGTSISIALAIPENVINLTYRYSSLSLSYYFSINNWRFEFGYDKDINFIFATGFNYYIPITVSFGYRNSSFFINASATSSDFDFGFDGLKRQLYIKINKNL